MAPKPKVDFVYLYFHFEPTKKTRDLDIKFRHNNTKIGEFLVTQRDWALQILASEVTKLPPGANVRFTEWRFATSESQLFELQNMHFEKILIILGEDAVYWSFYMHTPYGRRLQGRAPLELTYCPCCINTQYMKILDAIKLHVHKQTL